MRTRLRKTNKVIVSMYRRFIPVMLVFCLMLPILAVGEGPASVKTGFGSSMGFKSQIDVVVRSDGKNILDAWVVNHGDTVFIGDAAAKGVCEQVLKTQSLDIDGVTGATFTSRGIKSAIGKALEDIGVNIELFNVPLDKEYKQAETQEYDIVVVGGGMSGLTAGIAAKTNDSLGPEKNDLKVLLVERLGYTGGALRLADGYMMALFGTPYNTITGAETTVDEVVEFAKTRDINGNMNEALFRNVLEATPVAYNGLLDWGMYLPPENAVAGIMSGSDQFKEGGIPVPYFTVRDPVTGEANNKDGIMYSTNGGSPYMAQSLYYAAKNAGVEIRLETTAKSLIVENGVVLGIHVEDKNNHTEYDIKAKKVILATGGIGATSPHLDEYASSAKGSLPFGCPGNMADGQKWVEELGGVAFNGEQHHFVIGVAPSLGNYGKQTELILHAPSLWIDKDGNRFTKDTPPRGVHGKSDIFTKANNNAFGIIDSSNQHYVELVESLFPLHSAWKADSIEELATHIGVPSDNLIKTVDAYIAAKESGQDLPFDTPSSGLASMTEAPFYAYRLYQFLNTSDLSVKANEKCEVITKDGNVIPNLYASGAMIVSNYGMMDGGVSHMWALASGALAASNARNAIEEGK